MLLYERLASTLIGSPLQGPAERVRRLLTAPARRRHPELREIHLESDRIESLIRQTVKDGMNCLDVGCHLGSVVCQFARLSPSGKHLAVEPLPYKAQWLRRKFPAVDVEQVAVSDQEGAVDFFYSPRASGFSGLRAQGQPSDVRKLSVQCRRLDDLVPPGRQIDFIKLDVEGAEGAALRGARRILSEGRPKILFECTLSGLRSFERTAAEMYSLLNDELGYGIHLIKSQIRGGGLALDAFERAMHYPFEAFNFVAIPVE